MATRIQSRARQGDAALLTPAVVPLLPAQPRMPLIITFALVLGLALAVVAVYALEMLDRRVRSRLDLESRLAVPSLGRLSRWYPTGGSRLLPAAAAPAGALPNLS
jgi:capsular polysaccharide biosynthesis protein